eukprot:jgi/Bigna1/73095/fgenesh1_pg.22_\
MWFVVSSLVCPLPSSLSAAPSRPRHPRSLPLLFRSERSNLLQKRPRHPHGTAGLCGGGRLSLGSKGVGGSFDGDVDSFVSDLLERVQSRHRSLAIVRIPEGCASWQFARQIVDSFGALLTRVETAVAAKALDGGQPPSQGATKDDEKNHKAVVWCCSSSPSSSSGGLHHESTEDDASSSPCARLARVLKAQVSCGHTEIVDYVHSQRILGSSVKLLVLSELCDITPNILLQVTETVVGGGLVLLVSSGSRDGVGRKSCGSGAANNATVSRPAPTSLSSQSSLQELGIFANLHRKFVNPDGKEARSATHSLFAERFHSVVLGGAKGAGVFRIGADTLGRLSQARVTMRTAMKATTTKTPSRKANDDDDDDDDYKGTTVGDNVQRAAASMPSPRPTTTPPFVIAPSKAATFTASQAYALRVLVNRTLASMASSSSPISTKTTALTAGAPKRVKTDVKKEEYSEKKEAGEEHEDANEEDSSRNDGSSGGAGDMCFFLSGPRGRGKSYTIGAGVVLLICGSFPCTWRDTGADDHEDKEEEDHGGGGDTTERRQQQLCVQHPQGYYFNNFNGHFKEDFSSSSSPSSSSPITPSLPLPAHVSSSALPDVIIVDEVGSIKVEVLRAIVEGTGQAVLQKVLGEIGGKKENACYGRWVRCLTLLEPLRWGKDDPLENALRKALCCPPLSLYTPPSAASSPPSSHRQRSSIVIPSSSGRENGDGEEAVLRRVNTTALFGSSYHCDDDNGEHHEQEEVVLESIVQLFANTHYRSSPNDMMMLCDSPHHHLFALFLPRPPVARSGDREGGEEDRRFRHSHHRRMDIVCVLHVAYEGGLPKDSAANMRRRQSLDPQWLTSEGCRIVRIAVPVNIQNRGFGSSAIQLLESALSTNHQLPRKHESCGRLSGSSPKTGKEESGSLLILSPEAPLSSSSSSSSYERRSGRACKWLGVAFGVTGPLVRFWKRAGFDVVYLRQTLHFATGELSSIFVKALDRDVDGSHGPPPCSGRPPTHKAAAGWIQRSVDRYRKRFCVLLSFALSHLISPHLALELLLPSQLPHAREATAIQRASGARASLSSSSSSTQLQQPYQREVIGVTEDEWARLEAYVKGQLGSILVLYK